MQSHIARKSVSNQINPKWSVGLVKLALFFSKRVVARYVSNVSVVERQLQILSRVLVAVFISVPLVTTIGYFLGPTPFYQSSDILAPPVQGLVEVRDSFIFLGWCLIALLASFSLHWQFFKKNDIWSKPSQSRWMVKIGVLVAALIYAGGIFFDLDKKHKDNVLPLSLGEVVTSILFWSIVGFLWVRSRRFAVVVKSMVYLVLVIRPLSILVQTPDSLRDSWHFLYTANELAAPAAGMHPLVSFIPMYTNLLGYPIAPIIRLIPSESILIILSWILFMQAICLTVPVLIAYKVSGRQAAFLSALLMVSVITTGKNGGANGYFQVFPIRTMFPVLLLGLIVFSAHEYKVFKLKNSICLGLVVGLMVLNNLESGGPALIALAFTMALLSKSLRVLIFSWITIFCATSLTFILFGLVMSFTVGAPDLSYLTLAIRIWGSAGYLREYMSFTGFHNAYVMFFIMGMTLSFLVRVRAARLDSVNLRRVATFMAFGSSWGLFGISYFSGRSLTSTLQGSLNFQIGLLAVSILIWLFIDKEFILNTIKNRSQNTFILPVLIFSLFALIATIALTRMNAVHVLRQAGTVWSEESERTANLVTMFDEIDEFSNKKSDSEFRVGQILRLSNILELTTGVEAGLVVATPNELAVSKEYQRIQCEYLKSSDLDIVIEESDLFNNGGTEGSLLGIPDCMELLTLTSASELSHTEKIQLLRSAAFNS